MKKRTPRHKAEKIFAALLESQGKTWIYEPCRFKTNVPCEVLKESQVYIPDFYCPEEDVFYEVSASQEAYKSSMLKIPLVRELNKNITIKVVYPDGSEYDPLKTKQDCNPVYMPRKAFHLSPELFNWASSYVARKEIRGPKGNISFSELIRRLLEKEREKDEYDNKG